jgi:hypothetical protein
VPRRNLIVVEELRLAGAIVAFIAATIFLLVAFADVFNR